MTIRLQFFRVLCLLSLVAWLPNALYAGSGIFEGYAIVNGSYYDLNPFTNTANPNFSAANLGLLSNLNLGGQIKTYKNGSDNICGGKIFYSIYPAAGSPGTFSSVSLAFGSNLPNPGDQLWETVGGGNVLTALNAGNYKIAVYVTASGDASGGCTLDPFHTQNNGGAYFIADFSYCGNLTAALNGTYSVGTGGCFPTVASAVSALNTYGIAGPVTFNVAAGHTETLTGRIELTATGTAANPIIFKKNGAGANPKLTSYTGINATPSATADGFFVLVGSDYVTIDGIDLEEDAANTTTTTVMEFGYALMKASDANGCQNNTIKNCTITLNRLQNTLWTAPGHNGSTGIIVLNSLPSVAAALTVTAASGSNSFNAIYSNTIQNCNSGIVFIGFAATAGVGPAPDAGTFLGDLNNDIGGTSASTGNTILNFGGAAAATQPATGIFANQQWSMNCSYNTLNNNNGSGVNHPTTFRGIFFNSSSTSANLTCNNNNITLQGGALTNDLSFIENAFGNTAAGNTVTINNNTLTGSYLTATSGAMRGIYNNNVAPAILNIQNNTIQNWSYSGAALAGSGAVYPIHHATATNAVSVFNVTGNTVDNISRIGTTGATTIGIFMATGIGGMQFNVNNNTVSNLSISGTGTGSIMYGIQVPTGTIVANNNTVHSLSCLKTTGSGAMYGIYNGASPVNETYNNNTIYNLTHNGTGTLNAMAHNTVTGTRTVSGNTIYGITGAGNTIAGISSASSSPNIFNNKIYGISSTSTGAATVSGILIGTLGTAGVANVYNNYIGDLTAPNASSSGPTAPSLRGINTTTTSTGTTINLHHNTIYLNGSSAGANFATAGIFHTANATATTANLVLRNNIVVNTSTPAGTGFAVAYQRSSNALNNYDINSNANSLYAGAPSASNLIFYDGTNADQTLLDFQNRVATREAASISVDASTMFINTTGSSANYLHITAGPSQGLESGGVPIAGVTTDYDGDVRPGPTGSINGGATAPDIGADEFDGIPVYTCAAPTPGNTVASATTICFGETVSFTLQNATSGTGVTYQWQNSPNGSTWSNISGAITATYSTAPTVAQYYRCNVTCANGPTTTASNNVQITFSQNVATTTPNTRCGTGTTTLEATSGTGGTINWYSAATGGTAIGTGSPFTTPSIAATTTYYATSQVPTMPFNTGRIAGPTPPGTATTLSTYGHQITTADGFILNSLDVFSSTGTSVTINLYNAGGTTLLQTTGPITTNVGVQNTIPVNFVIPAGTYRLNIVMTGNFYRESSGAVYPLSLGLAGQIDGFFSNLTAALSTTGSYYFMYNLNVITVCSSPRVPVTATVTAPPALTLSASTQAICNGSTSGTVNITSTLGDFDTYTWNPSTDVSGTAGAGYTFNPTATTTYTLTGTQTSGSLCQNTANLSVTVNPVPPTPTITPATPAICEGSSTPLVASGSAFSADRTIGTATLTSSGSAITPYTSNYEGIRTQYLIPASELIAAGTLVGQLTALAFDVTAAGVGTYAQSGFNMKIGATNATALTNYEVPTSGFTTVYGPVALPAPTVGWNTITFSTPYYWDGTSNILIEICHENDTDGSCGTCYSGNSTVRYTTTAYNSVYGKYVDNLPACGLSNGTAVTSTNRPNMRFTNTLTATYVWSPSTNLFTDAGTTTAYTGTDLATVYAKPTTATTYTLTATNAFNCTATQNVTVNVDAQVTAAAGMDMAACNTATVTMTPTSPTLGTGAWSGGAGAFVGNVYTPSASESANGASFTATWTVTNGTCSATDNATITIDAPATANAGMDMAACNTATVTMAPISGTGTWSGGAGTFVGNVYTPSATESANGASFTATWTVTNGTCSATDNATITIDAPVTAAAGMDMAACNTATVTMMPTSPTLGTGAWSGGAGAFAGNVYTPSATESSNGASFTATWTVTNGTCSATDNATITIDAPATADAGMDMSTCPTTAIAMAPATPTIGAGVWTGGSGTWVANTYTPTAAESNSTINATWTVTNGTCSATDIAIIVVDTTSPTITFPGNQTLALDSLCNATLPDYTGLATANDNCSGFTLSQSPTSGTPIYGAGTTTVTLTVTDAAGKTASTSFDVTRTLSTPTITAGGNTTFCQGGSVTLNAPTNAAYTYQWYKDAAIISGANSASLVADTTGSYNVAISVTGGCVITSNAIAVTELAQPTAPTLSSTPAHTSGTLSVCAGTSVSFTTSTATEYLLYRNGTPSYYQNGGTPTFTINTNTAGTYVYTLAVVPTGLSCLSALSSSITLVVNAPTATITPAGATTFCANTPTTLNANTGANIASYTWKRAAITVQTGTNSAYIPTNSGNHNVTVTDIFGCSRTSSWTPITVRPIPVANAGADKNSCEGTATPIGANALVGNTYTWSPTTGLSNANIANPTATITATTTYSLTVNNSTTGCSNTDAVTLTFAPAPADASLSGTASTVCQGTNIVITPTTTGAASVNWYRNGTLLFNKPTTYVLTLSAFTASANDYTVRAKAANTCLSVNPSDTVTAWVKEAAVPTISSTPAAVGTWITICAPGSTTASTVLTANSTTAGATYSWKQSGAYIAGANTNSYTATVTTTANNKQFNVEATYPNGCVKNSAIRNVRIQTTGCTPKMTEDKNDNDNLTEIIIESDMLSAYPNPTQGLLNVSIENTKATKGTLTLTNALGQTVMQQEVIITDGNANEVLDLSNLAIGVYNISFQADEVLKVQKVIKE